MTIVALHLLIPIDFMQKQRSGGFVQTCLPLNCVVN